MRFFCHAPRLLARAHLREVTQITTCRKVLVAGAAQDGHAQATRAGRLRKRSLQLPQQRAAQRVALLGTIDGDVEHAPHGFNDPHQAALAHRARPRLNRLTAPRSSSA
jgi:hypothetical protein